MGEATGAWTDSRRNRDESGALHVTQPLDSLPCHLSLVQVFSAAENRFPYNTPLTKEAYYYRDIFDRFFPSPSAAATVPGGPSIACSTPRAMEWDASFRGRADPSGRAVAAVHESAYVEGFTPQAEGEGGRGAKRKVDGEPVQNGKDK